eukprot:GFUD01038978.1.p1 GENE.GFUD01038978.1~~GFUD01038978.1.p1  ORF type:complete len:287 (-),score=67.57 GFUD01038978.1:217-969(-)
MGSEGSGVPPVSPNLGQGLRVVVPRSHGVARGHGAGGTEPRGVEVVGRPVPVPALVMRDSLPDQRREVSGVSTRDDPHVVMEQPPVIDLSDGMEDGIQLEEISQAIDSNQPMSPGGAAFMDHVIDLPQDLPVTPQAQSHLNLTIDLTGSPDTPHLFPSQNPVANSRNQRSIFSLSSTSNAPSSPAPHSIQCPVCLESLSSIRRNGYQVLSTTCGHVFCSHCLPECVRLNSQCPTCRKNLARVDFHQLFLQ